MTLLLWLWRHKFRRPKWVICIHGLDSGNVYPMNFAEFRTREKAQQWADEHNAKKAPDPLTEYIVQEMKK